MQSSLGFCLLSVCVHVYVCVCVTPQLTRFQVSLLQHRQPLGPGTQDSDAAEEREKKKRTKPEEKDGNYYFSKQYQYEGSAEHSSFT